MKIEKLTIADKKTLSDVNNLLSQLKSGKNFQRETLKGLRATVRDTHVVAIVIRDDAHIVAMGFVFLLQTLQGKHAFVEDVVVDEAFRGKGLGKKLVQALCTAAKKIGATEIELTSKPSRIAANALYQKLGFNKRETNVYNLKL